MRAALRALRRRRAALPADLRPVRGPAGRFAAYSSLVPNYLQPARCDRACRAPRHPETARLLRARAGERRGGARASRARDGAAAASASRRLLRPGATIVDFLEARERDLRRGHAAAGAGPRGVPRRLPPGPRAQLLAARAPAGIAGTAAADAGGRRGRAEAAGEGEEQSEAPQNAEAGDQQDGGQRQEMAGYGETSGASDRSTRASRNSERPDNRRERQGHPVPGVGLPRVALQAQLELGAGEEARRVEHHRDQPPDEPVRDGAEAAEEGDPVAEADAARAAAAAARRRRHGYQRRGELHRREAGRPLAASPRSTAGARCASARSP